MGELTPDARPLLQKHGVTDAMIADYAKKYPPHLAGNLSLMAHCYLREKFGETAEPTVDSVIVKVAALKKDESVIIEALVASRLNPSTYVGCPTCLTSIKGKGRVKEGDTVKCDKCNKEVVGVAYSWQRYIVGDESGQVLIRTPPTMGGESKEDLTGRIVRLRGRLSEYKGNTDFTVSKVESVSGATPTVATTTTTTPPPAPAPTTPGVTAQEQDLINKLGSHVKIFEDAPDHSKILAWFDKQKPAGSTLTVEKALDSLGYRLDGVRIIKKMARN